MAKLTGKRNRGRRRTPPPVLAALDLGTNNCRLLVASPGPDGSIRILDSFSRIVRLGEGVPRTGMLSEAAIDRTIGALTVCAEHLSRHGVRHVRAIATEACRQASNTQVLLERAARETGIALTVITAAEEARLAAVGCAPLVGEAYEGALAFDIGGGSTEAIWLRRDGGLPGIVHFASISKGVMSLGGPDSETMGFDEMRRTMQEQFEAVRRDMDKKGLFDLARHHLLGTSGTVTTLAGVAMNLPRYLRSRVDASWHECADILAVSARLVGLDREARARIGCVGDERADLIVQGCAIFAAIHAVWPCARLRVADRGLREGILRELVAEVRR